MSYRIWSFQRPTDSDINGLNWQTLIDNSKSTYAVYTDTNGQGITTNITVLSGTISMELQTVIYGPLIFYRFTLWGTSAQLALANGALITIKLPFTILPSTASIYANQYPVIIDLPSSALGPVRAEAAPNTGAGIKNQCIIQWTSVAVTSNTLISSGWLIRN